MALYSGDLERSPRHVRCAPLQPLVTLRMPGIPRSISTGMNCRMKEQDQAPGEKLVTRSSVLYETKKARVMVNSLFRCL